MNPIGIFGYEYWKQTRFRPSPHASVSEWLLRQAHHEFAFITENIEVVDDETAFAEGIAQYKREVQPYVEMLEAAEAAQNGTLHPYIARLASHGPLDAFALLAHHMNMSIANKNQDPFNEIYEA